MKNKIKRFAKGDFHIPQPEIIFPETRIIMRVGEGEKFRGSFSLQNQGEGTIGDSYIPLLIVSTAMSRDLIPIRSISIIHMTGQVWCPGTWNTASLRSSATEENYTRSRVRS